MAALSSDRNMRKLLDLRAGGAYHLESVVRNNLGGVQVDVVPDADIANAVATFIGLHPKSQPVGTLSSGIG
ncbi:MAG: hypothetical protein ACYDBJ_20285 [Aggregatilineales bacterium]